MATVTAIPCPQCGHWLVYAHLYFSGEGEVLCLVCDNRQPECQYYEKAETDENRISLV